MELTPEQLSNLASLVTDLEKVEGVDITELRFDDHKVFVKRSDAGSYVVVGISDRADNKR